MGEQKGPGEVSAGEVKALASLIRLSLWLALAQGTQDLMTEYYKTLQAGEGRSEGLRQVRLKMLADPKRQQAVNDSSLKQ